jgi:RNA polymerase sigma-70 factor, ECF subfamily
VSADGQRTVSGAVEGSGVIALTNERAQSAPDIGTDDGVRDALRVYGPELRSFAARRLGSWGAAEDVVQETILRAWRKADRFDPARGTLRGWLYAILRNLLADGARSAASRPQTVPFATDVAVPDEVEALIGSLNIAAALQRLSFEHRQVFDYCVVRQWPHAEVAHRLGVPIGTIRSRLYYAREALKLAMDQLGAGPTKRPSEAA